MPGALRSGIAERSATALGVAALFIALATAAFDRIRLAVPAGDLTIRNSSVWRPAAGGALILLAAAPASILRAALVAVLALLALPIEGYEQIVDRTGRFDRPLAALRECARTISDRLANEGRRGPAIWSDAPLSYVPIYYFGDFGPWQRATEPSTASTLEWLLYRPARMIVLGQAQWDTLQDELATARADLLARLAGAAGPDPAVDQRLRGAVLGLVRHQDTLFLLPGPLSACGTELVPLVSR
jgi:hypothetical protein